MTHWNEILVPKAGTFVVNTTDEKVANHLMIVVLEDTVFNAIKVDGVDVKSSYIQNPATAVKAGAIITPLDINKPFSAVDLVSGSVSIVLQ
jgi:hypothetical protein